jgi:hypothetical protein
VVAEGEEALRELEILQLLNSEPPGEFVRPEPVLEFLGFSDWQFAVISFYDMNVRSHLS